jgi:GTP cyclohydrolase IA
MNTRNGSSAGWQRSVRLSEVVDRAGQLAGSIIASQYSGDHPPGYELTVYGVPRGGLLPAALLVGALNKRLQPAQLVSGPGLADIIVDDLVDSGATMQRLYDERATGFRDKIYAALFTKNVSHHFDRPWFNPEFMKHGPDDDCWLVFPWEETDGADESGHDIATRLMQRIGEDVNREGLLETPARFIKALGEWFSGYSGELDLKTFADGADGYDEMVMLTNIPVWSHCEHHIAPFFGVAHIAYLPQERIVGLSKLPRLVNHFSRRLQVQERLTVQIADALEKALKPKGVGVVLQCRHTCMESRGIKQQGVVTTTTRVRGAFMDTPAARAEFMAQVPRP